MEDNWVLAISTVVLAIATLLVFIAAVFQDRIQLLFTRPKLDVSINTKPPDCHKVRMYGPYRGGVSVMKGPLDQVFVAFAYYFRLRVKNKGNDKAESVEVLLDTLSRKQADGTYKSVASFLPMNLLWSNYRQPSMPTISPGTYKLCDLGHIVDPSKLEETGELMNITWEGFSEEETVLILDTHVKSFTLSHLIRPASYQLRIIIAAANTKPIRKTLEINLTGKWFEEEREMLDQGVGITMLN